MPPSYKVFVALWSRDTEHKLDVDQPTRLSTLSDAIDEAEKLYKKEDATAFTQPIKAIFVAPEYLFTRTREATDDDKDRALTVDEVNSVAKRLLEISNAKQGMLIVPGSVIYKYEPDLHADGGGRAAAKAALEQLDRDVAKKNVRVKTLAPEDTRTAPTIQTKIGLVENGDIKHFVRNRMYVLLNGKVVAKYSKMADMNEAIGTVPGVYVPGKKCGLETIEGIRFGFEICFDHEIGVLKALSGTTRVDFHVIASAWTDNNVGNMIADKRRFVLHASSKADNTAVFYRGAEGLPSSVASAAQDDDVLRSGIVKVIPPVTVGGDSLKCYVVDVR